MENLIKMDDLGVPLFLETPKSTKPTDVLFLYLFYLSISYQFVFFGINFYILFQATRYKKMQNKYDNIDKDIPREDNM